MLVHSVYFYFKPEVTEEQIANCRKMAEGLEKIETVKALYVGSPAAVPERPVVVRGYEFSLTVLFESIEDHNAYQVHPTHEEYATVNGPLWEKVRVFDSM